MWADTKESISSGELHISSGILEALSTLSKQRHRGSHTVAALGPEEDARVPMLQRGVTLAFLRRIVRELTALGRHDIDAGQFLNGVHTTSSSTDWKEFDRSRDAYRWVCVARPRLAFCLWSHPGMIPQAQPSCQLEPSPLRPPHHAAARRAPSTRARASSRR